MPYVPPAGGSPLWQNIQNKPSTFPPSSHFHDAGEIVSGQLNSNRIPENLGKITAVFNSPSISNTAYANRQFQAYTDDGSFPGIGLHRGGYDAIAIYWNGFELRTRRHTNLDLAIAESQDGTWIPTLTPGNHTYGSNNFGYWVRIGNLVAAEFHLHISAKDPAATGAIYISSLPYARKATGVPIHSIGKAASFSGVVAPNSNFAGLCCRLASASSAMLLDFETASGSSAVSFSHLSSGINTISGQIVYPIS